MTVEEFRRVALSLPEAHESSHFDIPDFRVANKIFATLSLQAEGFAVISLDLEAQAELIADKPRVFSPVPGGWGQRGATRMHLKSATKTVAEVALRTAWRRKAPKRLLKAAR